MIGWYYEKDAPWLAEDLWQKGDFHDVFQERFFHPVKQPLLPVFDVCMHRHTTQKCLLHVTSLQCVETYCGFLDAFRNSLHFGTLRAIFLFGIFGGSKMHRCHFLLDIVGRWLQQQPPLWVPRWIESKYCSTHLQHRNRPSWQTFAFNRTGLNVFRRDIIQMLVLAIRSFKGWKELWWSRTNNGWNWQDSSLKLISCKPSYSLDIYLYIYIQIYI